MTVYISTGGFSKVSADEISRKLIEEGIDTIELSGGIHSANVIKNLNKLKNKAKFQIHNYFPPPKIPFVLNLASEDKEIYELSLNHIYHALDCCLELNAKYYSFHAGFLCDLKINELGKKIKKRKLYDRKKSIEIFLERVFLISKKAENLGLKIMIENNVLSQSVKDEFGKNPLLMCDPDECSKIFSETPKKVKFLLDVAHLKVSANSLSFNSYEMFKKCNNFIGGYHLSDNNGFSDSNDSFLEDSWFWKYLKCDLDYYSIEVYKRSISEIKNLKDIADSNLSRK